jgi:hypothetical protein
VGIAVIMTSLWLDRPQDREASTAGAPNSEVAVVGAGTPGAVTTGNTTAKVSLLQGTRLSTISRRHSLDLVRQYVEGVPGNNVASPGLTGAVGGV